MYHRTKEEKKSEREKGEGKMDKYLRKVYSISRSREYVLFLYVSFIFFMIYVIAQGRNSKGYHMLHFADYLVAQCQREK